MKSRSTPVARGTLRSDRIFLATGSRATIEPIPGLTESKPLTHIEALELTVLPEHLIIIGGGFVGLEFAQAMRRFGARVTVVERNSSLAHSEDSDVIEELQQLFHDDGIDVIANAADQPRRRLVRNERQPPPATPQR